MSLLLALLLSDVMHGCYGSLQLCLGSAPWNSAFSSLLQNVSERIHK